MTTSTPPPLETARLALCPLSLDDVDALWPFVRDPELPRFMTWDPHPDPSVTRAFVERTVASNASGETAVYTLRVDGALAGLIGLHDVVRQQLAWRVDRAELGYWVGPPFQGQGLATEAARAIVRHGFTTLGLHKITVGCASANAGSLRVIAKLGFRLVGEWRAHFHRHGRWWDHRSFELLEGDWRDPG